MRFTYCCTMNYLDGHVDCDRGGQCFLNNSNVHLQWPSWLWLPIAIIVCFFSFLSGTFFIIWLYYIITLFCSVFKVNCYIIMVFWRTMIMIRVVIMISSWVWDDETLKRGNEESHSSSTFKKIVYVKMLTFIANEPKPIYFIWTVKLTVLLLKK